MRVGLTASGVLAVVGVAVAGFLGWRAYRATAGAAAAAGEWIDARAQDAQQVAATIAQRWANATTAPASGGDPVRAALYGREGYTGQDVNGITPLDGQWFTDEEARRYEALQAENRRLLGRPAPVVSTEGAAFGVYPKP